MSILRITPNPDVNIVTKQRMIKGHCIITQASRRESEQIDPAKLQTSSKWRNERNEIPTEQGGIE